MIDTREARNGGNFSTFLTEIECDDFIALQAVPGDWTKTFISNPTPQTPPTYAYCQGQEYQNVIDVVNDGAIETNLAEYTIPAEMLWDDGDAVNFKAFGTFFANANGKRLKAYVGSDVVFDSSNQIQNGGDWNIVVQIFKYGIDQKVLVSATYSNDVTLFTDEINYTQTTQDATIDILVRVTGEGIDPDDVIGKVCTANYQKAV